MFSKLALASFYTLTLLSGFLAAVIFAVMYLYQAIDGWMLLALVVLFNFIMWLIGPTISDWTHKLFYKIKFIERQELVQTHPELELFIAELTTKYNLRFPKIGLIADDNPTAYTYGSGKWNARIVITQGLFTYLQPEEITAVIAHEVGHIVHGDFIVMTIANTLLQLLYEISQILFRTTAGRGNKKGGGALYLIGLVAYVFYQISFYIVLFLNRLRESYADEFSATVTGKPQLLSQALIKIAYGITAKAEDDKSLKLLESSRTMGIMGFRTVKGVALMMHVTAQDPNKIGRVLLYDLVSPWAKIAEWGSTHPLTGKRLARLDDLAQAVGQQRIYNIPAIRAANPVDRGRLWRGFFIGFIANYCLMIVIVVAAAILITIAWSLFPTSVNPLAMVAGICAAIGAAIIIKALYRFPSIKGAEHTDVLSLMSDLYASPVHGRPISLDGSVIGRGVAGYMFSEDMMLQDKTGLMYLDYQAGVPLIGNLLFAWNKVKDLLGQSMRIRGWFFRSNYQYVTLQSLEPAQGKKFRSYSRVFSVVSGLLFFALGLLFLISPVDDLSLLILLLMLIIPLIAVVSLVIIVFRRM